MINTYPFFVNSIAWSKHIFLFDSSGILLNSFKNYKIIKGTENKIFILNFYLRSKYDFSENSIHLLVHMQAETAHLGVLVESKELSFSMIVEIINCLFIAAHYREPSSLKYRTQPFNLWNLDISEFAYNFKEYQEQQSLGIIKMTDLNSNIYTFAIKDPTEAYDMWGGLCYILKMMIFFCFYFNFIKKQYSKELYTTPEDSLIYTQNIPLELRNLTDANKFFEDNKYYLHIYRSNEKYRDIE